MKCGKNGRPMYYGSCKVQGCKKPTTFPTGLSWKKTGPQCPSQMTSSTICYTKCKKPYAKLVVKLTCINGKHVYDGKCSGTRSLMEVDEDEEAPLPALPLPERHLQEDDFSDEMPNGEAGPDYCLPPDLSGANRVWTADCPSMELSTSCTAACAPGFQGAATSVTCTDGDTPALAADAATCTPTSCALPALPSGAAWDEGCATMTSIGHGERCLARCQAGHVGSGSGETNACSQATAGAAPGALTLGLTCAPVTCPVKDISGVTGLTWKGGCSGPMAYNAVCTAACGTVGLGRVDAAARWRTMQSARRRAESYGGGCCIRGTHSCPRMLQEYKLLTA